MKRYKLIKCYPNSPKLGTEVNYSEEYQSYNYNGGNFYTELPKHQVENLPEFWEEVVEEPIYVTEDGYEVRDYSTELYWVYKNTNDTYELLSKLQLCEGHLKGRYASLVSDKHLWTLFYSEEKALEFIDKKNEEKLLDSKVLSYNEVLEIADKVGIREFYYRSQFEKELKELVKSKQ